MSQPAAKTANPTLKARWQEKISAAKAMWTKLTEPELTSIEGQAHKLADLVQKRYVTTREEADKQVTGFFKKHFSDLPSDDEIKGNWKQQVGAAKIAWGKLTEDELLMTLWDRSVRAKEKQQAADTRPTPALLHNVLARPRSA